MSCADDKSLVSASWLATHLDDPDIRIVDASYKMPGVTPTATDDYDMAHLPGAVFFDIDAISDKTSSLPHMLPTAEDFATKVGALGLGDQHRVIVYDGSGIIGAARVWWSFRAFGHTNVQVLDGGLPAWRNAGLPLTRDRPVVTPAAFTAKLDPRWVRGKDQILANLDSQDEQLLDARAYPRFRGEASEPWPGRRSGRIPGSLNLDHTLLIDPETKLWKPNEELHRLFEDASVSLDRPVITSCGSGITACVLALGLHLVGATDVAVYDGSWAEWGLPGSLPIATGHHD